MRSKLLPHPYKFIGLVVFILALLLPIILGALDGSSWEESAHRRHIAQTAMLVGLLIIILSKEKLEDEFIDFCRLRAFRAALIAGIVYFLQDVFGTFSGNLVHSSGGLLLMQTAVYLVVFHLMKSGVGDGK